MSSTLAILGLIVILYYAYSQGMFGKGTTPPPPGTTPPPSGGGTGGPGFAAVGDVDTNTETAANLAASGKSSVIGLGDYAYSGTGEEWWADQSAAHGMTWYGAQGNHDGDEYQGIFTGNNGVYEFTVTLGSIGFICVNTESVDQTFIQNAVEQFQADPAVKMIVPFMHIPIRTPEGEHHGAENTGLHAIFTANPKVKMVLNGHNHNMCVMEVDGIKYVQCGSGGRDLYPSGQSELVEFQNDSTHGIVVGSETATGVAMEFIENGGGSLYSFEVPFDATAAAYARSF